MSDVDHRGLALTTLPYIATLRYAPHLPAPLQREGKTEVTLAQDLVFGGAGIEFTGMAIDPAAARVYIANAPAVGTLGVLGARCVAGEQTACLRESRYRVLAHWRDFQGQISAFAVCQ